MTNNDSLLRNLSVTESSPLLPSGHCKICFSIQSNSRPRQRKHPTFVFNFTKGDYNGMCDYLLDIDFSDCLFSSSIEQAWSILKYAILTAMHIYIPKVRVKPKHHPKWFNSEIRHAINCLRTLRKKYSLNPTPRNISKLHSLESHLHQLMSAAKLLFERNLSIQGSANIFKYLSQLTSTGIIPPVVSLGSSSGSTDFEKVTLFNSFYSILTQSSYRIPPSEELPTPTSTLSDIGLSEMEALSSLDSSKSAGPDGISPKILKYCALALYKPIHHLFMLSLSQHYLPVDWQLHLITPVYKSGDKSSVRNYRPISLLRVISKVFERIIYDKISPFVSNLLSHCQFGFRPKHSTTQQLLAFLSNIQNSFSSNSQTDVIYLDFKKAFDSVSHNELLVKLWSFGITGNL